MWEEGARVFWAFKQTTVTSKCEAGLPCYGGQQTIRLTEPTSAVALVWLLPLHQICGAGDCYSEALVYHIVLDASELRNISKLPYISICYVKVIKHIFFHFDTLNSHNRCRFPFDSRLTAHNPE